MSSVEFIEQRAQRRQIRRAWVVLVAAGLLFAAIIVGLALAARFYWAHATTRETAALQVISGNGALVRSGPDAEWRLATGTTTVREGDDISTALGTVAWLTMFDGSTVEVSEDTVVHVARMRSSRFLKSTKHFIMEPRSGAVYVGMAPHGEYDYVEFTVRTDLASLTMADEQGRDDAGSFLFEVLVDEAGAVDQPADGSVRAAVLRGAATLVTGIGSQRLTSTQQTIVASDGSIGQITSAERELIENGSFAQGWADWVQSQQRDESASRTAAGASIELVTDRVNNHDVTAVEFRHGGDPDDAIEASIRQRVGKTLRVYSSLQLQFDAKISDQRPLGGGDDLLTYPLTVKLIYIDVQGQEREWSHAYYIYADPARPAPADRATRVEADSWEHTVFDLRNLSPLPKQITAIVVYASGSAYQTRVANLSLTSSELQDSQ